MLSEARKRANKKYISEKTDDIRLRVKKGLNMTQFIIQCVEKEITN